MKSINIITVAIVILLSGCLKSYHDTYVVVNNTNKNVQIEGFTVKISKENNENFIYNEAIEIQPNSKYTILKGLGENSQPRGIFEVDWIDSVNIIFNNQKIIKYKCDDNYFFCADKRNILGYNDYYEKSCGEHDCTYTYTITEADYESAEIIK